MEGVKNLVDDGRVFDGGERPARILAVDLADTLTISIVAVLKREAPPFSFQACAIRFRPLFNSEL